MFWWRLIQSAMWEIQYDDFSSVDCEDTVLRGEHSSTKKEGERERRRKPTQPAQPYTPGPGGYGCWNDRFKEIYPVCQQQHTSDLPIDTVYAACHSQPRSWVSAHVCTCHWHRYGHVCVHYTELHDSKRRNVLVGHCKVLCWLARTERGVHSWRQHDV